MKMLVNSCIEDDGADDNDSDDMSDDVPDVMIR